MASHIKGATILSTLGVIRESIEPARFQAILAACPVETQQLLRRTLMALEWIPVEVWSPVLVGIFERMAGRDENKFRRFMRAVCLRDFSGLYRAYVQNTSAVAVLAKAGNIWSAYFDSGVLTASPIEEMDDAQQCLLELRNFESTSSIYLLSVHAYIEQILRMVNAKNPKVQRLRELRREERVGCDYQISFG